jgi:2-polyprenyl-3-methyl-5-hydroxy-6-metoxy-1,4-benzoquinol methylase
MRISPPTSIISTSPPPRAASPRRGPRSAASRIRFHTGSLLDLPSLGLGPFDYIDCCGVLHHLEDPAAGLAALKSVLDPAGGIGLMLYGTLGASASITPRRC